MTPDNEDSVDPRWWRPLRTGALIVCHGHLLEVVEVYFRETVALWVLVVDAHDEEHYLIEASLLRDEWRLLRPGPRCPAYPPIGWPNPGEAPQDFRQDPSGTRSER